MEKVFSIIAQLNFDTALEHPAFRLARRDSIRG